MNITASNGFGISHLILKRAAMNRSTLLLHSKYKLNTAFLLFLSDCDSVKRMSAYAVAPPYRGVIWPAVLEKFWRKKKIIGLQYFTPQTTF